MNWKVLISSTKDLGDTINFFKKSSIWKNQKLSDEHLVIEVQRCNHFTVPQSNFLRYSLTCLSINYFSNLFYLEPTDRQFKAFGMNFDSEVCAVTEIGHCFDFIFSKYFQGSKNVFWLKINLRCPHEDIR